MAQHSTPAQGSARPVQNRSPRASATDADVDETAIKSGLTPAQARFLRGQAHGLKALLQVGGKGLTDSLLAEVDGALEQHELIKVKVAAEDRQTRAQAIEALARRSGATLVQQIGHVAVLYRPSREKRRIVLPRSRETAALLHRG